jgi:hypothetical protein
MRRLKGWGLFFCLFPLLVSIPCLCLSGTKDRRPNEKNFSDYFKKEKEIIIRTTGLDVSYFWQFLVDRQAHLLALDPKGCQLLLFDDEGHFLRKIGRQGQGPGEFNLPLTMCLDPPGRIHVEDSRMRRINTFSADGSFLKSFVFSAMHTQAIALRVDSAGNYYLAAMTIPEEPKGRADWLVKYDDQGKYSRSFYKDLSGRGWVFRMDPAFTFDIYGDNLYAMQINRYQVDLFNSDGQWLKTLCKPPEYFIPPDGGYILDERKYDSQKKLYDELIRLSKSWTRIMRLEIVDDRTILIMSAANGLVKACNQPYIIDLWTLNGELVASGIPAEYKFLCSDKKGYAYFLIHSDEDMAIEKDPTYIIGRYKFILQKK